MTVTSGRSRGRQPRGVDACWVYRLRVSFCFLRHPSQPVTYLDNSNLLLLPDICITTWTTTTMVQYQTWRKVDCPNRRTDWWKLVDPESMTIKAMSELMAGSPFRCPKSARKARVMERYTRWRSDRPYYETLEFAELLTFCTDRGLANADESLSKPELISKLRAADDDLSVHRFMELPPELRVHVYTLHFESFPILWYPEQPPISRVSRILRQESLPVFYQTCTFGLNMRQVDIQLRNTYLDGQSFEFFLDISGKDLEQIRTILLSDRDDSMRRGAKVRRKLDFGPKGIPVRTLLEARKRLHPDVKAQTQRVRKEVVRIRTRNSKLTRADFPKIRKAFFGKSFHRVT
jgi:hypothetical protein